MIYFLENLSSSCSDYGLAATLNLVHIAINVLQIVTPFVFMVSLAIALIRMIASPEDKKSNKRLINLILATLLCFLVPTILNIVLSLVPSNFAGMDIDACWRNAYNVDYSAVDRAVGIGLDRVNLKVDFSSLKDIAIPDDSEGGDLTERGDVNAHGVRVKQISGSGKNIDVVNEALKYEGYPYVWGAQGPDSFDCSGFVYYIYGKFGYQLGRVTGQQMHDGTEVSSLAEAKPGDLLVRDDGNGSGHVVMYIGNNQVIHAKGSRWGVVISPVSEVNYMTIRRIIQ